MAGLKCSCMYKQEFIFCEQVNERLHSSNDYQAFLKCLHIYSTKIITKKYLQSFVCKWVTREEAFATSETSSNSTKKKTQMALLRGLVDNPYWCMEKNFSLFCCIVTVGLPDVRGREEILKVHSKNKKLDKDVSFNVIALRTPGFGGADLANLMNEAAILAGWRGKYKITSKEIDDSIDRIVAWMEGTKMIDGNSKILVAYHEIGHAICATLTSGHDLVQKVTLIPRGQAHGLTWFMPGEDPSLISKQQLFARIVGGLEGRAAEVVVFGESEITTVAAGDLQQITQIARQMVTMFGMSEIGPWVLTDPAVQSSDLVLRMLARNSMSKKLAEDIDTSVRNIIDSAYEIAKTHVRNNREAMDKLVDVLLEKETLTRNEFRAILSEFTDIPSANMNKKPI
ncbi:ATP-dependent zinc metalloprotease FTSH 6, chloroplastic-like [Camellia sinensis]|uniref:ATP-dependent zinc metalloprotease FTSH 6, chloroplastic-like n=1 Tax=Camellia sinensis TaxID=4442 RepID=UPI001036E8F8|nr:ATP-dependent zinc metalloprotease FTSH 6, chloroplastic-like [Camellia sinensis]